MLQWCNNKDFQKLSSGQISDLCKGLDATENVRSYPAGYLDDYDHVGFSDEEEYWDADEPVIKVVTTPSIINKSGQNVEVIYHFLNVNAFVLRV